MTARATGQASRRTRSQSSAIARSKTKLVLQGAAGSMAAYGMMTPGSPRKWVSAVTNCAWQILAVAYTMASAVLRRCSTARFPAANAIVSSSGTTLRWKAWETNRSATVRPALLGKVLVHLAQHDGREQHGTIPLQVVREGARLGVLRKIFEPSR